MCRYQCLEGEGGRPTTTIERIYHSITILHDTPIMRKIQGHPHGDSRCAGVNFIRIDSQIAEDAWQGLTVELSLIGQC